MICVDEWGDEDTWMGWIANNTIYYPSIGLRISDMKADIKREMNRADREVAKIAQDEKKELDLFKICANKGVDREELRHRANLVSGHRARKRRQLSHKEAYQRCLQEVDEIERMRKQTRDVNKMSGLLTGINKQLSILRTQRMLRNFEMEKDKLNTKVEWVNEALMDEDTEADNKIQDSDQLIDTLMTECNIAVQSLPAPPSELVKKGKKPEVAPAITEGDVQLISRVERLGK